MSVFHFSPYDFRVLHGPALYLDICVFLSVSRNTIVMDVNEARVDWTELVAWSG